MGSKRGGEERRDNSKQVGGAKTGFRALTTPSLQVGNDPKLSPGSIPPAPGQMVVKMFRTTQRVRFQGDLEQCDANIDDQGKAWPVYLCHSLLQYHGNGLTTKKLLRSQTSRMKNTGTETAGGMTKIFRSERYDGRWHSFPLRRWRFNSFAVSGYLVNLSLLS